MLGLEGGQIFMGQMFCILHFLLILRLSYVRPRRWPNFHGSGQLVATVELLGE